MADSVFSGSSVFGPRNPRSQGGQGAQGVFSNPNKSGRTGQPSGSRTFTAPQGTSPVSRSGGIPSPEPPAAGRPAPPATTAAPAAPSAPAPAPQAPPAPPPPTSPDPFTAMGGGVWTGQGWVPRDHPLAQQAPPQNPAWTATPVLTPAATPGVAPVAPMGGLPQVPPPPGPAPAGPGAPVVGQQGYTAATLNYNDPGTYVPGALPGQPLGQGYQAGTVAPTYRAGTLTPAQLGQGYQAGTVSPGALPQYQAGEISQFAGSGSDPAIEQAQTTLMSRLLDSPEMMNSTQIAQLKEKQKEAALQMEKDQLARSSQNAASRGVVGGGYQAGTERRIQTDTRGQILQGQRDIDLAAMEQNRAAELGVLGAASSVLQDQSGRAIGEFGAGLQGEQAREQVGQAAAGLGLQGGALTLQTGLTNEQLKQAASQDTLARAGYTLQEGMSQEQLRQAEGQSRLQETTLQEQLRQAQAADEVTRAQYELQRGVAGENIRQGAQGLNLQGSAQSLAAQQAQAAERLKASEFANTQDNTKLAAAQVAQTGKTQDWNSQQADYQNLLAAIFGQANATNQAGQLANSVQQTSNQATQSAQQLAIQKELGLGNLALGNAQLGEDSRQFNTQWPTQQATALNQILMSRLGYGLDLSKLEQNGQLSMMEILAKYGL